MAPMAASSSRSSFRMEGCWAIPTPIRQRAAPRRAPLPEASAMSYLRWSKLCVAAAALSTVAHAASVPDFAPHPAVGWIPLYSEFRPPPSGPGPVLQDPAHPRVTNAEFRRTGRQPTQPIADLSNPILQPWVRDELRRHNALALSGQAAMSRPASCWPEGVPAFLLHPIRPYF